MRGPETEKERECPRTRWCFSSAAPDEPAGACWRSLWSRGVGVRAIVRSSRAVPAGAAGSPGVEIVEASLLSLSDDELRHHLRGCDAVVSCLGHVLDVKGVLGPPATSSRRATTRLCQAIEAAQPARPIKLVLMSSVSVLQPGKLDARRGAFEERSCGCSAACSPRPGTTRRPPTSCASPSGRATRSCSGWWSGRTRSSRGDLRVRPARGAGGQPPRPRTHDHGQRRALHVRAGDGQGPGTSGKGECRSSSTRTERWHRPGRGGPDPNLAEASRRAFSAVVRFPWPEESREVTPWTPPVHPINGAHSSRDTDGGAP